MIGYQFLLEIDALNQSGTPVTLRYACAPGYTGGGYTWEPRIVDPGLFQVTLFSGGKTSGASSYSYGEIVLANNPPDPQTQSGPIDALTNYQFFGKQVRMYVGQATAAFNTFTRAYTAAIENVTVDWERLRFTLRGLQADLDVPLNGGTFAGNNSLPNGLEGAAELKDKLKPILIGRALNFQPVMVNSSKLIYAVSPLTGLSCQTLNADLHVYDNGVELYCSGRVADIEAGSGPEPGRYTASANGYIRLGATPAGTVTCSAAANGRALVSYPANLIIQVLTLANKSGYVHGTSFNVHAAADRHEAGLYLTSQTTVSAIIDQLLAPSGYWYFDRDGKIRLGQVTDPAGLSAVYAASSATNVISFMRRKSQDTKGGVPASSVALRYARNYTVQDQPAGSVTSARRAIIAQEWQTLAADTNATPPAFSEPLTLDTARTGLLPDVAGLYTVARELLDVEIGSTDFLNAAALLPGDCVSVNLQGRFGYSGKKTIVVGILVNYVAQTVKLTLWS